MRSPSCLCVCHIYQPLNQKVDFYEIQYGNYTIENGLDAIFNPVASTIQKWRTFKLLRWKQKFHQWKWDDELFYDYGSSEDGQILTE
jgi:hypothetical protein